VITRIVAPAIRFAGICLVFGAGSLAAFPSWATMPAMPPPCATSFDSMSTANLADRVRADATNAHSDHRPAECANMSLSRRGEEVVPILIELLERHNRFIEFLVLQHSLCSSSHSGATAIPYLLERLSHHDPLFAMYAYDTLACMGKEAVPTIPFLMRKSLQSVSGPVETDGDLAINALGRLATYDPQPVVSHLTRLLDHPVHGAAAARALEEIGDAAKVSVSALKKKLEAAAGRHDDTTDAVISAYAHLGRPNATVPILISLLDSPRNTQAVVRALQKIGKSATKAIPALIARRNDPQLGNRERDDIVFALAAINARSPLVLPVLLEEATNGRNYLATSFAAQTLANVDPLPSDFASELIARIPTLARNDSLRSALEQALEHTHTRLKPTADFEPLVPKHIEDLLVRGLWALAKQPNAITLDDVIADLHLDAANYEIGAVRPLSAASMPVRWAVERNKENIVKVSFVQLSGIFSFFGEPASQEVAITLDYRFCVSQDSFNTLLGQQELDPNSVLHRRADNFGSDGSIVFAQRDERRDARIAQKSRLVVSRECVRTVSIRKEFDAKFWNELCPFNYDNALIEERIVPAIRHDFAAKLKTYDLNAPVIGDYGAGVELRYWPARLPRSRRNDSAPQLVLNIDRCSREITRVFEY